MPSFSFRYFCAIAAAATRAPGTPPAPPPVAETVLGFVGEIGMRGAVCFHKLGVILGLHVLVVRDEQDGRTRRLALEVSGENFYLVGLLPRCRYLALAGASPIERHLYLLLGNLDPRRAAVHDDTDRPAVGLAEGRYPE